MAAIVWPNVVAFAPELANIAITAQAFALLYVNATVNPTAFDGESGHRTRMARIWLAAHVGAAIGMGSVAGPIIEETGGGLAEQYQPLATAALGSLGESRYGREYAGMIRRSPAARGPISV